MRDVYRIKYSGAVDADGHILEPPDLWERYLEPRFRERALRIRKDEEGLEYLEIGGKPSLLSRKGFPGTLGAMGKMHVEDVRPSPPDRAGSGVRSAPAVPASRGRTPRSSGCTRAGRRARARGPRARARRRQRR